MDDQFCQEYISNLYKNLSGYISHSQEYHEKALKEHIVLTYGEILYSGVNTLIDKLKIAPNDIFYDLGSGIGKLALQIFLKSSAKKVIGIEASAERHQHAVTAYQKVKQEHPQLFYDNRELIYTNANFLQHSIQDATMVFCDSVCFSEELLQKISALLNACPNLKYLVSSKKIPIKLPIKNTIELECSWQPVTKCYLYCKD